jgi:hypothetical protein
MDINAAVGGKAGLSPERIEVALGVKPSHDLSERERLALEYADRVSATPVDVSENFFAELRQLFSEREIVELTAHIAHENYNAKSNRPLRVEANNFCDISLHRRSSARSVASSSRVSVPCFQVSTEVQIGSALTRATSEGGFPTSGGGAP